MSNPTMSDLKSLAVRAVVTFLQVALSILVAANIFGVDGAEAVSVLESAAAGGAGAVLSLVYNFVTNLGQRLEGGDA